MISAKRMLKDSAKELLLARDLPKGTRQVALYVLAVRANSGKSVRAAAVMDIEPIHGKAVYPLNVTAIQALAELTGDDDLEKLTGMVVTVGSFEGEYDGEPYDTLVPISVREMTAE